MADTIGCQNRPYPQFPWLCANTSSTCSLVLIHHFKCPSFTIWMVYSRLLSVKMFDTLPWSYCAFDTLLKSVSPCLKCLKLSCQLMIFHIENHLPWSWCASCLLYWASWLIDLLCLCCLVICQPDQSFLYYRYWKLSLLVHPDKCPHPSAQEAFVKLNNAFKDLQDPQKVHVLNIIWFAKCPDYLK